MKKLSLIGVETVIALIGTVFCAVLLVLTAMNAGPLWRDEVNTINMAQMPSLEDMWQNMPYESFPPLWLLLLRSLSFLGLVHGDMSIRAVGLCVGLFFLASLWLCSRWIGARAPILSVALLGFLPAFIFIVGENRAYGLACCLSVLSFGTLWRVVELPSKSRIVWAGVVSLLFVQCLYYDVIFLCAMLTGAAMVTIRHRQWRTLAAFAGIGFVSCASMVIYLPIVHRASTYMPLIRDPFFSSSAILYGFCQAMAGGSSGKPTAIEGLQIWFWVGSLIIGLVVALTMQRRRKSQIPVGETRIAGNPSGRSDLALYCAASIMIGIGGLFLFLLRLQFFTQPWYFIGSLAVCAIALDGILGPNWAELKPWGFLRIGLMVLMMICSAKPAWAETHTRRSNVDLATAFLTQKALAGDLIVVDNVWEGIPFARYYQGQTRWLTIPPIDSHTVHRNDLVMEKMTEPETMIPLLHQITGALRDGHSVWLVGDFPVTRLKPFLPGLPPPPPPRLLTKWWLGTYLDWWNRQITTLLLEESSQEQIQDIPAPRAINSLEDVSVVRFFGYQSNDSGMMRGDRAGGL